MRKDIEIHIKTGDVAIDPQNKFKLRTFRWVEIASDEPAELSRYIYGEIEVPYTVSESAIRKGGLYITIPYTPAYKEFKLRIRRAYEDGTGFYVTNETNGSQWFVAKAAMYGKGLKNVFASELPSISESSFFISLEGGAARVYSCNQSDFNIVKANRQNANCMLACVPGSNYRYPLTGVGLVRWVNSTNVMSMDLTSVIQKEFSSDGVTVKEAAYNYDTQQMELEMEVEGD